MLIDNLVKKSHHSIQLQLATGNKNPTDLHKLIKRCQRIKFKIKNLEQNKALCNRELACKNKNLSIKT